MQQGDRQYCASGLASSDRAGTHLMVGSGCLLAGTVFGGAGVSCRILLLNYGELHGGSGPPISHVIAFGRVHFGTMRWRQPQSDFFVTLPGNTWKLSSSRGLAEA